MVDNCEELIGMDNLYFKVYVKHAQGLPENLCVNPFVSYQFKFDKQIYQTDKAQGKQKNPAWGYEKMHKIDHITKAIADDLESGCISFQVYGYPPTNMTFVSEDGGAALQKKKTMKVKKVVEEVESELEIEELEESPKPAPVK